eukprot:TRINITY_DN11361_c0_g1_i1.p1 TRINITY_DN11361_c0_g1~~TRINITY_DN11361_c0_g1_i1.p1  ORF type:complete len:958 (+),score=189.13 TRINITY_DN11361_c0_g1_i1:415-2874(+)
MYIALVYLPRNADNNANLRVRFRAATVATSTEACNYDNLTVYYSNTALSSGSVTPYSTSYGSLSGSGSVSRTDLTFNDLVLGSFPTAAIPNAAFALPANAANPTNYFEGTINLLNEEAHMTSTQVWLDTYSYYAVSVSYPAYDANYFNGYNSNVNLVPDVGRAHLPSFSFSFVQDGSHFIPSVQTNVRGTHKYWEIILGAGRVWNENSDNGWSRVSLPFSLTQRNAGCVHNGLMTFLFRTSPTVDISFVRFQITQETCKYFSFDMYGTYSASMQLGTVANAATIRSTYEDEVANRIPAVPMSSLPSAISVSNLYPSTVDNMTVFGTYIDNTFYRSDCFTHYDAYPFCENFVVPSYSTFKSFYVAMAAMRISQQFTNPTTGIMNGFLSSIGTSFWNMPIASVFDKYLGNKYPCGSFCGKTGCAKWIAPNTVATVLDMATGNYRSTTYMADEDLAATTNDFFLRDTMGEKMTFACNNNVWPGTSASGSYGYKTTPGTTWAYHTSDFFIMAKMMDLITRNYTGLGLVQYMNQEIFGPLKLSSVSRLPRTTYESGTAPENSQVWGAWGGFFVPDDIVKITNFLNQAGGRINGVQILDYVALRTAFHRKPGTTGLNVPSSSSFTITYKTGFWNLDPWTCTGCVMVGSNPNTSPPNAALTTCLVKTPFASGYGGITVAMLPNNNSNYYYFSDGDDFTWHAAAENILIYRPSCNGVYAACAAEFTGGVCNNAPLNIGGDESSNLDYVGPVNFPLATILLGIVVILLVLVIAGLTIYTMILRGDKPLIFGDYFGNRTKKAEERDEAAMESASNHTKVDLTSEERTSE